MSNYSKIKEIILKLNSNELLKGKLYIVGGTVPYLIIIKKCIYKAEGE